MNLDRLAASRLLLIVTVLGSGCRSVDRFQTDGEEAFCGKMLAPSFASTGLVNPTEAATLELALGIDSDRLDSVPAWVKSNDKDFGACNPEPLFASAQLRIIPEMLNDRLGALELGQDHALDLMTLVDSTCLGSMVAVLSLIQDGHVELRLIRPAPEAPGAAPIQQQPGFAAFTLERHKEGCGF